ncbi:HNH endonuclease family protein [Mucilaginibacter polytrichastri]|uniref:HNH nuclease domain-containing protein n=1 Tax=Mucilaginibacter polytrichastri TaxID=1302689 RepID=A0A1Q5ZY74_9SPHI|nr:HNH endonuclease [Mucilaginibacter polytrichastri]OKS86724.1 hypothetical protein RG47T_2181 [Mucilaginibacter polytrichastri]SFS82740.1 hypothetical protein SAMN04487890_104289 [Mucilaginibacter polytrichastri]
MIRIKRPPAPAFMTDPHDKWMLEIADACQHYQTEQTAFPFKHYKDPAVKDELKKVFKKCAYCDFPYASSYDGDVEHFRPKGRVIEKTPPTPGYYWLANTWENLLLSCQHCNQSRKHLLSGEKLAKARGKLDQFPLSSEIPRMQNNTYDITQEDNVRLLLNPCIDDPAAHLGYDDQSGVIQGLTPMGEKSIDVYVLARTELTDLRQKRMLEIFHQMEVVKRELDRESADFMKEFRFLLGMTGPDQPFAGMARYFVKQFISDNQLTVIV